MERWARGRSWPRRLATWLQRGTDDVVEALLPARCRHCDGEVLPVEGEQRPCRGPASRLCSGKLRRPIAGPWSVPLRFLCARCASKLRPRQRMGPFHETATLVSAFEPTPPFFSLLHVFKYEGFVELAPWFGAYLARAVKRRVGFAATAVLLPVPLHEARLRTRGFNQSLLLARQVGRRLGIPLQEDLLRRVRSTAPLAGASDAARQAAVRGAFLRRGPLPERTFRLLLVDDVVTTGATCAAAMDALRLPAERLTVVCLCRARPVTIAEAVL